VPVGAAVPCAACESVRIVIDITSLGRAFAAL